MRALYLDPCYLAATSELHPAVRRDPIFDRQIYGSLVPVTGPHNLAIKSIDLHKM